MLSGAARNPFSILTKSTLIERDVDLLVEALRRTEVQTALSIGCLDPDVWRATEPHTPSPRRRMETVARLNAAGVPTCEVMIAPVLPGISDSDEQLEEVVKTAVHAGATVIAPIALHLRGPLPGPLPRVARRRAPSSSAKRAGATAAPTRRRPSATP